MIKSICVVLMWTIVSGLDDELFLNTPQILDNRNLPYENHTVITEDGYILTVFRVLKDNPKGIVLLMHSMSLDSSVFFVSAKRSIAMDFYNAGYELWLPNFRGLDFSDKHTNINIRKMEYWDFSYHEIGYYDFPAIINHVRNVTGSKMFVINHSLSSTASLVYSSLRPKEAVEHVKLFVNTAASAFMNGTESPFRYFIPFEFNFLKPAMEMLNFGAAYYDFQPYIKIFKQMMVGFLPMIRMPTDMVLDFLFGYSGQHFDPEEFPMVVSVSLKSIAMKIMYHYSQNILSGKFRMYDYGQEENLRRYNSTDPPDYPIENIRTPIFLVISNTDTMSDAGGSTTLFNKLPPVAKKYGKMEVDNVNHADYLVGNNRFKVFDKVLEVIKSIK